MEGKNVSFTMSWICPTCCSSHKSMAKLFLWIEIPIQFLETERLIFHSAFLCVSLSCLEMSRSGAGHSDRPLTLVMCLVMFNKDREDLGKGQVINHGKWGAGA